MAIKSVTIFCGAKEGVNPIYKQQAQELVELLAERNICIITGGGNVGLMGAIADKAIELKAQIVGVIPQKLIDIEHVHTGISNMLTVSSMDERKKLMAEMSDAFIMLPGGFGSLDEYFDMLTLKQLEFHNKPTYVVNTNGYYDQMFALFKHMQSEGFLAADYEKWLFVADSPAQLLKNL